MCTELSSTPFSMKCIVCVSLHSTKDIGKVYIFALDIKGTLYFHNLEPCDNLEHIVYLTVSFEVHCVVCSSQCSSSGALC